MSRTWKEDRKGTGKGRDRGELRSRRWEKDDSQSSPRRATPIKLRRQGRRDEHFDDLLQDFDSDR